MESVRISEKYIRLGDISVHDFVKVRDTFTADYFSKVRSYIRVISTRGSCKLTN